MTSPILVTGGTGTLGRHVVPLLRDAGSEVRVLSRHHPRPDEGIEVVAGDLVSGEGVNAAVQGAETVVHLAGSRKGDDHKTRALVQAASAAGVGHLVYISVVGAERIPVASRVDRMAFGYFAAKRAAERIVEESGIPWTTLRATQFHDLTLTTTQQMAKMPVIPVPSGTRFQPIDTGEVAGRLVELTFGQPTGLVPDIGGPRVFGMDELLRSYLRASGRRRLLVPVRFPGKAAAAVRDGANLTPAHKVGKRTWEDFLAERVSSGSARTAPAPGTPAN